MTDKQQKIIDAALELFAHQGYANTSTSKIARQAGVSEGLIFRHFTSKEGLLEAIVRMGLAEMRTIAPLVLDGKDPRKVLEQVIRVPVHLVRTQSTFWKLQFSLKHQQPDLARKYDDSDILIQLKASVERAFRQLNYANPKAEAKLLLIILGGLVAELGEEDQIDQDALINFVLQKYQL